VALFGGMWLDSRLQSGNAFTLVLVIISVPVSLVVISFIAWGAAGKMRTLMERTVLGSIEGKEETDIGRNNREA